MGHYTQSRTAFPVTLELYEVEALIDYHRGSEYTAADDRDYSTAESSKSRREDLEGQLLARRKQIQAEALEQTKKNLAAQLAGTDQ